MRVTSRLGWASRYRAPVSLVTCALFVWSLAASVPRAARAQELAAPGVPIAAGVEGAANDVAASNSPVSPIGIPDSAAAEPGLKPKPGDLTSPVDKAVTAPTTDLGVVDAIKSLPGGPDKSGVSSQVISVPQGSGKVQGMGESFSAQLSTGIATLTIPFALPSPRGSSQPALTLGYSSGSGHGNAGVGWDVGVPFIARQTDRGIPTYLDPLPGADWTPLQDRFVFNGGQELVPICLVSSGGECAGKLSPEAMPAWAGGWQYFRARVEGSFLRFFWSPDHRTWRVQSKSGETMELGVPLDGSLYGGALDVDPAAATRIFRWNLARQYDAQREVGASAEPRPVNVIAYRYMSIGSVSYLTDVYDTPPVASAASAALSAYAHHTKLRWEARTDPTFSYRRGWRATQTMRLVGLDIASMSFAGGGERELVRRYHLAYDPAYHVSLLSAVQEEGRCATAVTEGAGETLPTSSCPRLPPMRFAYQHVASFDTKGAPAVSDLAGYEGFDERIRSMEGSPPHSVDEELTDLFDVNGDALPDVVVTAAALFGGKHGVFWNGKGGKNDSFSPGTLGIDALAGTPGADATTLTLKNLNVAPGDLDGDGTIDLLHMPMVKTYSVFTPRQKSGRYDFEWFGRPVSTASSLSPKINFGKDASELRLMDVNGDGLVDVVYSSGTEVQTFFALGRLPGGDGRFGQGKWTSATTALLSDEPVRACVPWAGTPVRFSDAEIKTADVNGDGLPDLVKLQKGNIQYWPGRGDGTWGTGTSSDCKAGTFSSGTSIAMTTSPWYTEPSVAALRLDDVNGDGLDDLVQVRFTDIDVWLNVDGLGWTDRHVIKGTPAAPSYASRVRLVDIDGSGTRDILWGDGLAYKYIDLLGGKRPWALTHVSNGLGKTTELEYASSTDLMLAAEKAGAPWSMTAPIVLHVVVKETVRDNLAAVGRTGGVYVTEYSYADPYYDGAQREFRGFRRAVEKRGGDANSPTSSTATTFLLGECLATPSLPAGQDPCRPQGKWRDEPGEALKGLPVVSEKLDEKGVYLSTTHHGYTLRTLYAGRDGRAVRHVFEKQSDSFSYDTGDWVAAISTRNVTDVSYEPPLPYTPLPAREISLRSSVGRVLVRSNREVDVLGNVLRTVASGCVEGCPSSDELITRETVPSLVAGDSGRWMVRVSREFVSGSKTPGRRHEMLYSYDVAGNRTETRGVLSGTLGLDRFHEDPSRSIALEPSSASADGVILIGREAFDGFGNAVASFGPLGRCRATDYDTVFADLPVTETTYAGAPVTRTLGGVSAICGSVELVARAGYDRGFEVMTSVTDLHGEKYLVEYDGFGRTTSLTKPDPSSIGVPSARPSVKLEYVLPVDGSPLSTPYDPKSPPAGVFSTVRTLTQDGASFADDSYREGWAFVDGLERTIATLKEADPLAGDEGSWVVHGLNEYDAKGAISRAPLAWFYTGTPDKFPLSSVPPTRYTRVRYDAFERPTQSFGLDGVTTQYAVHHALSTDQWDAADLTPGPHQGTPASARMDGHGRTVSRIERAHAGSSVEERELRIDYLATGEVARVSRIRVGKGDAPIVRWMQYDSLGRMVLNVEPNTSTSFDPNPATFRGTAWRYAHDDAGELVGTSDARGCGINYIYDTAGRLVAEDYSPCSTHHDLYSAPDLTWGSESGVEALNRYDYAPPTSDITSIKAKDSDCDVREGLYLGRLTQVFDRGARTVMAYDGRGRLSCVARQMAKPGVPADSVGTRYTSNWFVQTVAFDGADRPIRESTGASVAELTGGDGKSRVAVAYSARGSVKSVGGSYGTLVASVVHDAEELPTAITYGDIAATKTAYDYDDKLRLRSVQTYRGPPSSWLSSPSAYLPAPPHGALTPTTLQLVLEDLQFTYDAVDNPTEIRDWRDAKHWPAGARPVTRKLEYDDLYRLSRVAYQHAAGDDKWVPPFERENAAATSGGTIDPRLAKPSPQVSFDKRLLWQTFRYDWLGNTVQTEDDARGFHDRSLGTITNGAAAAGPYRLTSASNESTTGPRTGALTTRYDAAGNLVGLAIKRAGTCLPTGAACGQRFAYEWDEANRLARARRWDLAVPGAAADALPVGPAAAELRYQYDIGNHRTLKTAVDSSGNERHTVYVAASLELRRTTYADGEYARGPYTEVPYLFAHRVRLGRVAYKDNDVPTVASLAKPRLHILLELGDHLGSTDTVIDKDTSELVEKTTYQAFGATESDYRPDRWKGFREDHRFTGKEEDVELGIQYFGARYYAPALGRWLSADPLVVHGGDADLNLYAYVQGRVLAGVDRDGLDWWPTIDLQAAKKAARDTGFAAWGAVKGVANVGISMAEGTAKMVVETTKDAIDGTKAKVEVVTKTAQGDFAGAKKAAVVAVQKMAAPAVRVVGGIIAIPGEVIKKTDEAAKAAADGNAPLAFEKTTEVITTVIVTAAGAESLLKGKTGGPCSFAAGTLVATADGWIPIEQIGIGDLVWALDEEYGGAPELKAVEETFTTPNHELATAILRWDTLGPAQPISDSRLANFGPKAARNELPWFAIAAPTAEALPFDVATSFGSSLHTQRVTLEGKLNMTLDHPLRAGGEWVTLEQLWPGATLWAPGAGRVQLLRVEQSEPARDFNLRVAEFHTYLVSAPWPVWVHNNCGSTFGGKKPGGGTNIKANAAAGKVRDAKVGAALEQESAGGASIQNEMYLRDAAGKIVKDKMTGTARRVDKVVFEGDKATRSIEVTSDAASKSAQMAKEARIRGQGGTFVKDRRTGTLVDISSVPTEVIRTR